MLHFLLRLGPLSLDLTPSTFRKTAVGITAAAFMLGGVGTSAAQQVSKATLELTKRVLNDPSITLQTNCTKYLPGEIGADALCSYRQGQILKEQGQELRKESAAIKSEGAALKRQEQALDTKLQAEANLKSCLVNLAAFKANSPAEFVKLGTITRENACSVAAKLPKPTASAAKPSAG